MNAYKRITEDERTRTELIEFVNANTLSIDERHSRWIAWLEKQGKQEWTDEDEENFQHTLLAIRKSTWYTDSDKKELKEFVVSLKQRLTDDTQRNRTRIVQSLS